MKKQQITFLTSAALATVSLLTINSNKPVQAATVANSTTTNNASDTDDLANAQKNASEAKLNLDNATKAYNEAKDNNDATVKAKGDAQAKVDSANKAQEQAKKDSAEATTEGIQKAKDNAQAKESGVANKNEAVNKAVKTQNEAASSLKKAQDNQNSIQAKVNAQQSTVDNAQAKVDSAQKAFDATDAGKAQTEFDKTSKKVDELTTTIKNAPKNKQGLETKKSYLQKQLDNQDKLVKDANSKVSKAKSNSEEITSEYNKKLADLQAAEAAIKALNESSNEAHITIDVPGLKKTLKEAKAFIDEVPISNVDTEKGRELTEKANNILKAYMDKQWQNNKFKSNIADKNQIIDFQSLTPEQNIELAKYLIGLVNDIRTPLGMPALKLNNSAMQVASEYAKGLQKIENKYYPNYDFNKLNKDEIKLEDSISDKYGLLDVSTDTDDDIINIKFDAAHYRKSDSSSVDDGIYENEEKKDNKFNLDQAKYDIYSELKGKFFNTIYNFSPFSAMNINVSKVLNKDNIVAGVAFKVTHSDKINSPIKNVTPIFVAISPSSIKDKSKFNLDDNVVTPSNAQEAQQKLSAAQNEFNAIKPQKDKADKAVNNAIAELDSVNSKQKDLTDSLAKATKAMTDFDSKIAQAQKDLEPAQKAKAEAKQKLDEALKNAKQQKQNLEKTQAELKQEQNKLSDLQANLKSAKKSTEKAQKTLDEKVKAVTDAKVALDKAKTDLSEAKQHVSDLENAPENLKNAEKAVQDATQKLNEATKNSDAAKIKLDAAQKTLDAAQTAYDVAEQRVKDIQARIDAENALDNVVDTTISTIPNVSDATKKEETKQSDTKTDKDTTVSSAAVETVNKKFGPKNVKLTHTAFVYDKNGKVTRKGLKINFIKRGKTVKALKIVTIKGKKYFQIGKNKFIKVANTKLKTIVVHFTAKVKGKKSHKVATFARSGKHNKHYVRSGRSYKFNEKIIINGKTYYKIAGKNDWVAAKNLKLK